MPKDSPILISLATLNLVKIALKISDKALLNEICETCHLGLVLPKGVDADASWCTDCLIYPAREQIEQALGQLEMERLEQAIKQLEGEGNA